MTGNKTTGYTFDSDDNQDLKIPVIKSGIKPSDTDKNATYIDLKRRLATTPSGDVLSKSKVQEVFPGDFVQQDYEALRDYFEFKSIEGGGH